MRSVCAPVTAANCTVSRCSAGNTCASARHAGAAGGARVEGAGEVVAHAPHQPRLLGRQAIAQGAGRARQRLQVEADAALAVLQAGEQAALEQPRGERSAPGVPALTRAWAPASPDKAASSAAGTSSSPSISSSAARARRTACSVRSV